MSRTLALPYDEKSPALARRYVEQFAWAQNLDGTTTALCLIVTELVTNAVLHGLEPVELTLQSHKGEVTIEVADGDPQIHDVQPHVGTRPALGGRGLQIVASLADRWGTRPSQTGKTVWATVKTTHA